MAVKLKPRRRLTVDEYQKMGEVGILARDEHTELIDGEIVQMSPIGGRHVQVVSRLTHLLVLAAGASWGVNVQSPIALPPYSEPQPDIAVVKARSYGREIPRPEDVLLVMEVSDSSLEYDRETKLPMYADYGISEAWVVDINGETTTRYTEPMDGSYTATETVHSSMEIESMVLPGLTIRVDEILDL